MLSEPLRDDRAGAEDAARPSARRGGTGRIMHRRQARRRSRILCRIGRTLVPIMAVIGVAAWAWQAGHVQGLIRTTETSIMRLSIDAGFVVDELTIKGRKQLSPRTIAELVGIHTGDPMLIVDSDEITSRLLEHPWIHRAEITRHIPNRLEISIVERQPIALWQHDGRFSLIDREGAELPYGKLSDHADLIVLAGQDAPRQATALLALLDASPGVAKRVRGATWVSGRRWNLHLDNGIEIRLPRDDPARALRNVATAHERQGLFERDILSIDARDLTRIAMRLSTHGAEERRASRN